MPDPLSDEAHNATTKRTTPTAGARPALKRILTPTFRRPRRDESLSALRKVTD